MAYTTNGPRAGKGVGRMRNTLANNASKNLTPPSGAASPVPPPPVSPSQAVAYAGQTAALGLTLAQRLAQGRAQRGILQGQFRMDKASIRAQEIQGMSAAEDNAIDRGVLGSSGDLKGRIAVQSEAAAGVNSALQAKVQGLLGIKLDRIAATNDYYTGLFDIQARKAADQQEAAVQAFLQDMVMRMNDEQGGGGRGGPGGARFGGAPTNTGAYGIPTDTSVGGNSFVPPSTGIPTDTSMGGNNSAGVNAILKRLLAMRGSIAAGVTGGS